MRPVRMLKVKRLFCCWGSLCLASSLSLLFSKKRLRSTHPVYRSMYRGRTGFDGDVEAGIAGRGAAGLVKSGTIVIGNDYDYAYAA